MANEEAICEELKSRFPFAAESVRVQRTRRVWAEVPYDRFAEVFGHAVGAMQFSIFCTLTGTDDGDRLGVIYHVARPDGTLLNLKTAVPKADPKLETISERFPASVLYERELIDLLGFQVQGLPAGNRYPLQDDWPAGQHPLRKDWNAKMLEQTLKEGE